jgi:hypothetical protein
MDYRVRTGQNQCQVIRRLDKRSHISKNICQVQLVMTHMPTGQTKFCESLGLH